MCATGTGVIADAPPPPPAAAAAALASSLKAQQHPSPSDSVLAPPRKPAAPPATQLYYVLAAIFAVLAVVVSLYYALGVDNMVCFGGRLGRFGRHRNSRPFFEFQVQDDEEHLSRFQSPEVQCDIGYIFGMDNELHSVQTPYQHIAVHSHRFFGNVLVIDGSLQITERDEGNYHEIAAHVPMAYVPDARKALVVGGGDGGVLLRLLQHPNVQADLVDIDMSNMRAAVDAYFPALRPAFTNPRARLFEEDGSAWVDRQLEDPATHGSYEVVVLDSTDYGAAKTLFTESFYLRLKRLMATKSVFIANVESPSWDLATVVGVQEQLSRIFKYVFIMHSFQPTFLSGHFSFVFCSDAVHPMRTSIDWGKYAAKHIPTEYYNEDVHYASFILPNAIRRSLTQGAQLNDLPPRPFTARTFPQRHMVMGHHSTVPANASANATFPHAL